MFLIIQNASEFAIKNEGTHTHIPISKNIGVWEKGQQIPLAESRQICIFPHKWWFTILEIPGFTTLPQQQQQQQPLAECDHQGPLLYCSSSAASAASGGGWDQTRLNLSEKRSSWWQLSEKVDFCCQCFCLNKISRVADIFGVDIHVYNKSKT